MPDVKKHRPIDEISKDYGQLVYKAGDLQYKVSIFSEELDLVNKEIKELNLEAAAAQRAESEQKEAANGTQSTAT